MDLKNDHFTITREGNSPIIAEMIAAVKKAGFGAEKAKKEAITKEEPTQSRGDMPELISKALIQAKTEGKLVLVDFYANWCGPCLMMLKETFPNPKVQEEMRYFIFVKVDTDKHPEVSKWYGVVGIPDVRILSVDGNELERIIGFKKASEFSEILKDVHRKQRE